MAGVDSASHPTSGNSGAFSREEKNYRDHYQVFSYQLFGFYAMAEWLLNEGKQDEAYVLMADAAKKSPPATITPEDTLMRREAWESTGASALDAKLKSVMSDATANAPNILLTLATATRTAAGPIPESPENEAIQLQRIGFLEHIRQINYRSLGEEMVALSEQIWSLSQIDPELEYGDTGLTVVQYKKKIEDEVHHISKNVVDFEKSIHALSDADLGAYADRWLSLGEVAAMRNFVKSND